MEIDGRFFQALMAQQNLNGTQIGAGFEQMRGETVTQGMGMDIFAEAGMLGGLLTGLPNGFWIDRSTAVVTPCSWKEPHGGFSS